MTMNLEILSVLQYEEDCSSINQGLLKPHAKNNDYTQSFNLIIFYFLKNHRKSTEIVDKEF
jgi:hypothetical protein